MDLLTCSPIGGGYDLYFPKEYSQILLPAF